MWKNTCAIFATIFLISCGGGGGGSSNSSTTTDRSDPNFNLGSVPSQTGYASASRSLRQFLISEQHVTLDADDRTYVRTTRNERIISDGDPLAFQATKDTDAEDAWRLGWTGRGVKVGHLDDFIQKDMDIGFGGNIAHGNATVLVNMQVSPEVTLATRQLSFGCGTGETQDKQITDGFKFFETNGFHIVNNSWGSDRYDSGTCSGSPGLLAAHTWQALIDGTKADAVARALALPVSADTAYDENMLFVFAAGNDAENCSGGIDECNLLAASIHSLREEDGVAEAGERVLFVGALNQISKVSSITRLPVGLATYSHSAGEMINDFIVAHADIAYLGDAQGTSFAAPRVTGAAALVRHKFPNLNGPQLKQVLIRSADDLGDPGPDAIFGAGKLNVISALSPIGGLTD